MTVEDTYHHCHLQESSLRWFEFYGVAHYPAGNNDQKMVHCCHKRINLVSNRTAVLKWWSVSTKTSTVCQENIPLTVCHLSKHPDTRQDGYFHVVSTLRPKYHSRDQDSSDQAMLSQSAIVQFLLANVSCSYCFLSWPLSACLPSGINKTFLPKELPLTGCFLLFRIFAVNPEESCM